MGGGTRSGIIFGPVIDVLSLLLAVHILKYTGYDKFEQAADLMKQDKVINISHCSSDQPRTQSPLPAFFFFTCEKKLGVETGSEVSSDSSCIEVF